MFRVQYAKNQIDQRRLARAAFSDEGDGLLCFDGQVNAGDGRLAFIRVGVSDIV